MTNEFYVQDNLICYKHSVESTPSFLELEKWIRGKWNRFWVGLLPLLSVHWTVVNERESIDQSRSSCLALSSFQWSEQKRLPSWNSKSSKRLAWPILLFTLIWLASRLAAKCASVAEARVLRIFQKKHDYDELSTVHFIDDSLTPNGLIHDDSSPISSKFHGKQARLRLIRLNSP